MARLGRAQPFKPLVQHPTYYARTSTGTPTAQSATVTGAGVIVHVATGTPTGQVAHAAGAGLVWHVSIGTLNAQAATTSGSGVITHVAAGTPAAQSATTVGTGAHTIPGAGALHAQSAVVVGYSGAQPNRNNGLVLNGKSVMRLTLECSWWFCGSPPRGGDKNL